MSAGLIQPKRVCLVTTGHPSTNPRLVKEADALSAAGYAVRVVACKFLMWADAADAGFEERPWWPVTWVRFGAMAPWARREWGRVRRRASQSLAAHLGFRPFLAKRAFHYVVPELARAAAAEPAELYIAHNLAALPAAAHAAARHRARLGFDAEDFHRGEIPEVEQGSVRAALTRWAEEHYIPLCDYVTAASDGIAEAYARVLGIERPTTILNVFPLAERDVPVPEAELEAEKTPGTRTLYWFSQTIGPGRGLETALEALVHLEDGVHLALRGAWADAYESVFMAQADALGVRHRVHALPPAPPSELVVRAARHDVGLALELPDTLNRDICVTNKIFTYLVAGLPTIASATEGQRRVCAALPSATRVVPHNDSEALAMAAKSLLGNSAARPAARSVAAERFNWEVESQVFLQVIRAIMSDASRISSLVHAS